MKSFLFMFATAVASAASQPFNILFVLSDDHSAPHMGCYGDPNVMTPNFARLLFFPEGVIFSDLSKRSTRLSETLGTTSCTLVRMLVMRQEPQLNCASVLRKL